MKSTDPAERLGVYKSLDDVPPERRLDSFDSEYDGREVWDEYLQSHYLVVRGYSERKERTAERAWRSWTDSMDSGRHPALCTPQDVEVWSKELIDEFQLRYGCNAYWMNIERFYTWLLNHVDHPHVYHPFWMASAEYPFSGEMWQQKIADRGDY